MIDASGKYVMPGIVNTHMHWHEERVGPIPIQYERNLYLASGVTTAREVGGTFEKTKQWRAESAAHTIVAPRIVLYPMLRDLLQPGQPFSGTPAEFRALVRAAKERGADGIKLIGPMDRDQAAAAIDEAKKVGLPTTVHIAVGEATARDFVDLGVNCIEHFYGIADASLDGVQDFPPEMNLANEIHRFGRAGELYTQNNLNHEKLSKLLDDMVAKGVAWSPTMSTYEATRDLVRAQNLPWYKDYLHPSLEDYYKPSMTRHATFYFGWTSTQEAHWRKNYEVWMATLREFGAEGRHDYGRRRRRVSLRIALRLRHRSRARAAAGSRLSAARSDSARDGRRRQGPRAAGQDRPRPRRFRRRPARRQRQSAPEPAPPQPVRHRSDDLQRTSDRQLLGRRAPRRSQRRHDPRRRHRVDDQGRRARITCRR